MKCPFAVAIVCALLIADTSYGQVQPSARTTQESRTLTARVSRAGGPALTLTPDNVNPATGQSVRFTAAWNRAVSPMRYKFDFGDGQFSETQELTANHTYSRPGTYTAKMSGTAITNGATMLPPPVVSKEVLIKVSQSPAPRISLGDQDIKISPGTVVAQRPSPPAQGIPAPPVLTLAADNMLPQPNQIVHFRGTWNRNVNLQEYLFKWGDGETTGSREPAASHFYPQPGTYTVRLTATSLSPTHAARTAATQSNELIIRVAQPSLPPSPTLTLSANKLNAQTGDAVHFTVRWTASKPPRSRYVFDWGDSHASETNELAADHSYAGPGLYRAHVTAHPLPSRETTSRADIPSNELLVRVTEPVAPPPVTANMSLTANLMNPRPNQRVHFTVLFDRPVSRMQYRYFWGDGQYDDSDSAEAYHSYSSSGMYRVQVSAKGIVNGRSFGGTSNEMSITVKTPQPSLPPQPPLPEQSVILRVDQQHAKVGGVVLFTASLDPPSGVARYRFFFGDGSQQDSQTNQVVYSYARGGDFQPWVTVFFVGRDTPVTSHSISLTISEIPQGLPLWAWILVVAGVGGIGYLGYRIYHRPNGKPEPSDFHVEGFSDAGVHSVTHVDSATVHLSLTLKPGMDSADHEVISPKRAAA